MICACSSWPTFLFACRSPPISADQPDYCEMLKWAFSSFHGFSCSWWCFPTVAAFECCFSGPTDRPPARWLSNALDKMAIVHVLLACVGALEKAVEKAVEIENRKPLDKEVFFQRKEKSVSNLTFCTNIIILWRRRRVAIAFTRLTIYRLLSKSKMANIR